MMTDPIVLEAFMWVAVFLSLPAVWWVFSVIGTAIGRVIFSPKYISLTVIENGTEFKKKIYLDDTDELVKAVLSMKEKPST